MNVTAAQKSFAFATAALTLEQAADVLQCSVDAVRQLTLRQALPVDRQGNIPAEDLLRYAQRYAS